MPEKVRVNFRITKRNHERLKELIERVPDATMSAVVDEMLDDTLPAIFAMLDEADKVGREKFKNDEEAQERIFNKAFAEQMVQMLVGSKEEFIHTLMELGGNPKKSAE